jgi:hypothetical protein
LNLITIPVSIGEAIDKQTILEIKMERITSGNEYVRQEYSLISEQINPFISEDAIFHKNILKAINEQIWDLQDEFRNKPDLTTQSVICDNIIQLNDARFRIKNKLDKLLSSTLKEQKGYQKKKAFYLGHLGLGDQINCIPIVRYIATLFDYVTVVCKKKHVANLKLLYKDDLTINFYPVESDEFISPHYGFPLDEFKRITSGFEVFTCGLHNQRNSLLQKVEWDEYFSDLPFCFYKDLALSPSLFYSHHHIASSQESDAIYDLVKGFEYIVIQSSTSEGPLINLNEALQYLNIDPHKTLLIDINQNFYPVGHIWHAIAEAFINKPLSFYKKTLTNAHKLILTDSSLFCMAITLPLKCTHFYYKSRNHHDYSYIYQFLCQQKNIISYSFLKYDA